MRWGTLERVPHTPQNFSRTNYYWWEPTFAPGSSLRLRSCMAALVIPATVVPEGGLPGWLPVRRALAAPSGGLPSLSPAAPAFSFVFAPIPPAPFPHGEGGDQGFFHARGFAPCIPGAESGRHGLNLRWRCPAGGLPSGAPEQGAKPTPAGACPSGRRLGQMFRCRVACRIFQSRQKRLSRFCNTQNHSHHVCCKTSPGPGTNAGSNQKYIGKVLGGLGASFKKPPTFPRFPVSRLYLFSLPMR